jgi:hypothetical protein
MDDDLVNVYMSSRSHAFRSSYKNDEWLYGYGFSDNIHNNCEYAFKISCRHGRQKIAQWIYSLGNIDNNLLIREFQESCRCGSPKIIKWIYNLGIITDCILNEVFIISCESDDINIAKLLFNLNNKQRFDIRYVF